MESWRRIWRDAAEPLLSDAGLASLAAALTTDDPRLLQGATTTPPPLQCVRDWPVEAACLLGYPCWQGDGLNTVEEIETAFTEMCFAIDKQLNEPAGCRWLLNWFDETPRDEMRAALLSEVNRSLALRAEKASV